MTHKMKLKQTDAVNIVIEKGSSGEKYNKKTFRRWLHIK